MNVLDEAFDEFAPNNPYRNAIIKVSTDRERVFSNCGLEEPLMNEAFHLVALSFTARVLDQMGLLGTNEALESVFTDSWSPILMTVAAQGFCAGIEYQRERERDPR